MANTDTEALTSKLRHQINLFMHEQGDELRELRAMFARKGIIAYLFGGVPRSAYNRPSSAPRDFDLVVADQHFSEVLYWFETEAHLGRRNRFGGLKFRYQGLDIDAWSLSSTWAFRQSLVRPSSFANLPQTTFFNADAIAVEFSVEGNRPRQIFEHGFFEAWHRKLLDINLLENPFPLLCVIRAARLALHYEFRFSPRLTHFIAEVLEQRTMLELRRLEASHYGSGCFPGRLWAGFKRQLARHLKTSADLPFAPFQQWFDQFDHTALDFSRVETRLDDFPSSSLPNYDQSFLPGLRASESACEMLIKI